MSNDRTVGLFAVLVGTGVTLFAIGLVRRWPGPRTLSNLFYAISQHGYMKMGITARGHRLYGAGLTALLGVGMTAMGVYLLVT